MLLELKHNRLRASYHAGRAGWCGCWGRWRRDRGESRDPAAIAGHLTESFTVRYGAQPSIMWAYDIPVEAIRAQAFDRSRLSWGECINFWILAAWSDAAEQVHYRSVGARHMLYGGRRC